MTDNNKARRVLNRIGAREMSPDEVEKIIGTGKAFATPISIPFFPDA
jgi:hypothetical protein